MTVDFNVLIEIPRGSRNKYEVDHASGLIRLDRTLLTTQHPADYGFVPEKLGRGRRSARRAGAGGRAHVPRLLICSRPIGRFRMTGSR
jgi:inorganic pyrophosphatase